MDKLKGDSKVRITKIGDDGTEVVEFTGNTFLNEGINRIWSLVCGDTANAFTADTCRVGVGDGDVSADATQTSLQGSSTYFVDVALEYPKYGSDQIMTVRGIYTADEANFNWNEITVSNGNENINRLVQDMGSKPSGDTWIVDMDLILE